MKIRQDRSAIGDQNFDIKNLANLSFKAYIFLRKEPLEARVGANESWEHSVLKTGSVLKITTPDFFLAASKKNWT